MGAMKALLLELEEREESLGLLCELEENLRAEPDYPHTNEEVTDASDLSL